MWVVIGLLVLTLVGSIVIAILLLKGSIKAIEEFEAIEDSKG